MIKLPNLGAMYRDMAAAAEIVHGQVQCKKCGATAKVDGAWCLRNGWPKCCGYTMGLVSDESQAAIKTGRDTNG
jgi:hypothetical protein